MNTKRLESDRLILREFVLEDAIDMYNNWASDPLASRFLSWEVHKDVTVTKSVLENWISEYKNGSYNWVVELKDSHEIIGSISCITVSEKNSYVELGYCYGSKYWNKGYASEALRRVIEYLILEKGFYIVEARHISGNPASGRVMEKAGMKKDAVLRVRKINKYTKERNDLVVYSITKEDL